MDVYEPYKQKNATLTVELGICDTWILFLILLIKLW